MTTAIITDFTRYDEQFQTAKWEGLYQYINGFNAASAGAIRLVSEDWSGDYKKQTFFKSTASAITRRDDTSLSAATVLQPNQAEAVAVKVKRKYGPVGVTLDALKNIDMESAEAAVLLGTMFGPLKAQDMLNTALIAVEAAIEGQAAMNYDATGESTKTLIYEHLIAGQAKMGDQGQNIRTTVFHSKPRYDLLTTGVTSQPVAFQSNGVTIFAGDMPVLGTAAIMTDASALTDANGSAADTYNTLGLVEDAVMIEEVGDDVVTAWLDGDAENVQWKYRVDYELSFWVKGMAWDVTNGGRNPTNAALGTTTNWDLVVSDAKLGPGVRVVTR